MAMRSRGRRSIDDVAKNTTRILDAAEHLFLTAGYSVPMEAIASAAKLSRHALYVRFPEKRILFVKVVERLIERWEAETQMQEDEALLPMRQQLEILATRTLRILSSEKAQRLARLIISEGERFPELWAIIHQTGLQAGVRAFSAQLNKGKPDQATPADPQGVAIALIYMLIGWALDHKRRGPAEDDRIEAAARYYIGLLIDGQAAW